MTYPTWGFQWRASWMLSLPADQHSIISSLLSCVSLLNAAEILADQKVADTWQNTVICILLLKLHIKLLSEQMKVCCAQALHKFVTVLLQQSKNSHYRRKTFCLAVPTLTPNLPRHSKSRHIRLFRFKAQGIFRWNVKVYLLILSHFKLTKTLKTRMILTQIDYCTDMYINLFSKLCLTVMHRNCRLMFQAIEIQGKNHEFQATHGITLEL